MRNIVFVVLGVVTLLACSSPPDQVGDFVDAQATIDASLLADAALLPVDAGSGAADANQSIADAGISLACSLQEVLPIAECAYENCAGGLSLDGGLDTTQLATCIATNCFIELLSISPGCLQCITSGISGDVASLLAECTGISAP